MADLDLHALLEFAIDLARHVGSVISAEFYGNKDIQIKGRLDVVTATDKKVEEICREKIKEAYPLHHFMGEESFDAVAGYRDFADDPTWIIDPIDGTKNFVHANPFCCVSIALTSKKQPVLGVVFNPMTNEMFTTTLGGGAHLNGNPIHASSVTELRQAAVITEFGEFRNEAAEVTLDALRWLLTHDVQCLRACGSAALALCYVACGRADAFFERGLHAWDIAAAVLIVKEAGGAVKDTNGSEFDLLNGRVLGTNKHLEGVIRLPESFV
eukprot:TRINITY_DN1820_c0_g1_i1.p2 TRINITY_DN1820_c0_g1~~TRINITY_DN1820_c0_g1_i1.p2  ORF type:complete len:269 (-),score=69.66 TRINITY_DN1820_c0_g1_i1:1931-2737(-)